MFFSSWSLQNVFRETGMVKLVVEDRMRLRSDATCCASGRLRPAAAAVDCDLRPILLPLVWSRLAEAEVAKPLGAIEGEFGVAADHAATD